jgi:hypothetical protein
VRRQRKKVAEEIGNSHFSTTLKKAPSTNKESEKWWDREDLNL